MDIQALFQEAVANSKLLAQKPDNETLLKLYALYKQATEGDADSGAAPTNPFDFVAKAKFSAWEGVQGTSKDSAMQAYVDLVNKLRGV